MKRKPVTLLLCCLCLALLTGAYLVLKRGNEKAEQEAAEQSDTETILTVSPDDVRKLSFQIDGSNVTFCRTDDEEEWKLEEDENFPVDSSAVSDVLECLAPLDAVRTLTDTAALSEYGLDAPQNTVAVTTKDGTKTTIELGDTNSSTGDDYIMLNGDDLTLYTISTSLRSSLSNNLYDYAAGEELPVLMASDITDVDVSFDSQSLMLSLSDNLWTVSDRTTTLANVDQEAVSQSISDLTGLSYVDFLDYNCTTPEQYGLNPPTATITISWKDDNAGDSGKTGTTGETELSEDESELSNADAEPSSEAASETDTAETELTEAETGTEEEELTEANTGTEEDAQTEAETGTEEEELTEAETEENSPVQQLILHIGTTDESGNYYVQQEGSTEIHTMAADLIEKILGWTAGDFEAEPESETETETDSQAAAETEADSQAVTETEADSQAVTETEADSQAVTETEAESQAVTETEINN